MIKIELTINEEQVKEFGDVVGFECEVQVKETRIDATRTEKECSEIIKDRLRVTEKMQLIDKTKSQDAFEKILKHLI